MRLRGVMVAFRRLVLASVLLVLGGCGYSMVSGGQLRPEVYDDLTRRTTLVRGGQLPDDLKTVVIAQSELPELIRGVVTSSVTVEEIGRYQTSLEAVGVWPRGRDYLEEYLDLAGEQIAGLYWPQKRTLYVVEDASQEAPFALRFVSGVVRRDIYGEFVLAHELVHAVQHTMFPDLMGLAQSLRHHDDLGLALSASLEGDALLFGMESSVGSGVSVTPEEFADTSSVEFHDLIEKHNPDVPLLIAEALIFPYVGGYQLAFHERRELLESPPISTEQVYHEGKRDTAEAFTFVDISAISRDIAGRCDIVWHNTLGEFGMLVLFNENTPDAGADVDAEAWRGWDGDRYLVADCDGRDELLWVTLWDTEEDAVEFEVAYGALAEVLDERAGSVAPRSVRRSGREVVVSTGALDDWGTPPLAAARTRVATFADVVELLESIER